LEINEGDKVRIIPNLKSEVEWYGIYVNNRMVEFAGQIVTIMMYMGRESGTKTFLIKEDNGVWLWGEEMFLPIRNTIKKLKGR